MHRQMEQQQNERNIDYRESRKKGINTHDDKHNISIQFHDEAQQATTTIIKQQNGN
jgi:hypothetical protein